MTLIFLLNPYIWVQNCFSLFKTFFNNNSINHDVNSFQSLERFSMNYPEKLTPHTHKNNRCISPKLSYFKNYERNYIYMQDGQIIYQKVSIPVFYCDNCEHYHALLPSCFIIPYLQYSLLFVISVLDDYHSKKFTISNITEKYDISKNTLYRWIEAFHINHHFFITLRNKADNDFLCAITMRRFNSLTICSF